MQTASTIGYASNTAVQPKELPMQEHARRLQNLSEELAGCNARLGSFLDRTFGQVPENAAEKSPEPIPSGALVVAQFGATKIANGLDRLRELIARAEAHG